MLLPRWFPIHLSKMSYWARTVIVPLLVLAACQAWRATRAASHSGAFRPGHRRRTQSAPHQHRGWALFFNVLDRVLKLVEPLWPKAAAPTRHRPLPGLCHRAAERRGRAGRHLSRHGQRGDDVSTRWAIRRTIPTAPSPAERSTSCWSSRTTRPIASLASRRSGIPRWRPCPDGSAGRGGEPHAAARPGMAAAAAGAGCEGRLGRATARCAPRRLGLPVPQRPLSRSGRHGGGGHGDGPRRRAPSAGSAGAGYDEAIARGAEWIDGLQSRNGGWGAFDADNVYHYLNNIPFADHGALLDPPTDDVSAPLHQHAGPARRDAGQRAP